MKKLETEKMSKIEGGNGFEMVICAIELGRYSPLSFSDRFDICFWAYYYA